MKKTKKKIKIKYKNVFLFLCFLFLLGLLIYNLINLKITNIYITNTTFLKDRYILEKAKLMNKPTIFESFVMPIKENLEKDKFIQKVKITRQSIFDLHLNITENKPLFYNDATKKTVLEDGTEINERLDAPKLLNYVPDKKYKKLIEEMRELSSTSILQISEMKYEPNDKDDNRFLLSMIDGNYTYVTLGKLEVLNSYLDIMLEIEKKFENKRGILYLDSGQYFEVLEN